MQLGTARSTRGQYQPALNRRRLNLRASRMGRPSFLRIELLRRPDAGRPRDKVGSVGRGDHVLAFSDLEIPDVIRTDGTDQPHAGLADLVDLDPLAVGEHEAAEPNDR